MARDTNTSVTRESANFEIREWAPERASLTTLALILLGAAIAANAGTKAQSEKQPPSAAAETKANAAKGEASGDAANGKQLFRKYGCYECHGTEGNGGTGPRINQPSLSNAAIIVYVRHPSGQMPPYTTDVLTDDQLADICAYIKSIPPPRPASSIALLE